MPKLRGTIKRFQGNGKCPSDGMIRASGAPSPRDERIALTLRCRSAAKASKGDGLAGEDRITNIILRGSPKTASTSG